MPSVVAEIFGAVLLIDCELFEEPVVRIICPYLHILLILF